MNIILISHDASRTGAPILLLNLADALRKHGGHSVGFLLKSGNGDLYSSFSALGVVGVAGRRPARSKFVRAVRRLLKAEPFSGRVISDLLTDADLVISNTITNGDILPHVRKYFKGPILSYIHELEMATGYFTNPEDLSKLLALSDRFIVPAFFVKEYLTEAFKIPAGFVDILDYYIPPLSFSGDDQITKKAGRVFTVGAAGTTDWRKAADLFIAIAALVYGKLPGAAIRFAWKGAFEGSLEWKRLNYDLKKAGLEKAVSFIPASSEVGSFYEGLDLFLLTSREDPYPLVVLEAARAAVPSICFKNAGGAAEFIEEDAGACLSYLDLTAVAEKIIYYYTNRDELIQAGEKAREKLRIKHQQPGRITKQLDDVVTKLTRHGES